MKKIYENHWSFASIPGRIAEFIANNPVKAATYSTITLLLTITLTSTVIGQNLVLTIAGLAGISFYCSLYILIITGFVVMAADKTIESLIYPSQKKQENTEKFKPYNINPIARLWQAIDLFLSKFYVLGMQNPISMLFLPYCISE